jgi:hypothetical protein
MLSLSALVTKPLSDWFSKKSSDATARQRRNRYKDKFWTAVELLEDRTLLSGTAAVPTQSLTTPGAVTAMATGDMNGDGRTDIVTGMTSNGAGANSITIGFQTTAQSLTFIQSANVPQQGTTHDLALGDLDGDGDLDIAAVWSYDASPETINLSWYENLGGSTPSFLRHDVDSELARAARVAIGDINGDTHADLVVAFSSDGSESEITEVLWYQNQGTGVHFQESGGQLIGSQLIGGVADLEVYNIDIDSDVDILVAVNDYYPGYEPYSIPPTNYGTVQWLENTGAAPGNPFVNEFEGLYFTSDFITSITIDRELAVDLPDILVTVGSVDSEDGDAILLVDFNPELKQFNDQTILTETTAPFGKAVDGVFGDVDGDGDRDVVVLFVFEGTTNLGWIENEGGGAFASPALLGAFNKVSTTLAAGYTSGVGPRPFQFLSAGERLPGGTILVGGEEVPLPDTGRISTYQIRPVPPLDLGAVGPTQTVTLDMRDYFAEGDINYGNFFVTITAESGVTTTVQADNYTVRFTPLDKFSGPASFSYRIDYDVDGEGGDDPFVQTGTFTMTVMQLFDFGDAPDSYGTAGPSDSNPYADGARHGANDTGVRLGETIDYTEVNGLPTQDADGDDLNGSVDDEDGVTLITGLEGRDDQDVVRTVRIEAPAGGKLDAWIDFNENGIFDTNERVEFRDNRRSVPGRPGELPTTESTFELDGTSLVLHEGVNFVDIVIPQGAVRFTRHQEIPGGGSTDIRLDSIETYARFRISSAGGLDATGYADDGEVEDFRVTIGNRNPLPGQATENEDFEDALDAATDLFISVYADELEADPDYIPNGSIPVIFQGDGVNRGGFGQGDADDVLEQIVAAINAKITESRGPQENIFVFIAHPVDFIITDPQGRTAGHTAALGTFNNIGDNCSYSGDGAIELLVIRNASSGGYNIDFTGVGGVFRGGASLITSSGTQSAVFQGGLALSQHVSLALDYSAPVRGGIDGSVADASGALGQAYFNILNQVDAADGDEGEGTADALAALAGLDAESESGDDADPSRQISRWINAVRSNTQSVRRLVLNNVSSALAAENPAEAQELVEQFWSGLGQSMLGGVPGQLFQLGQFLGVDVPMLFGPSESSGTPVHADQGAESPPAPAVENTSAMTPAESHGQDVVTAHHSSTEDGNSIDQKSAVAFSSKASERSLAEAARQLALSGQRNATAARRNPGLKP